ncbi:hypothetical protein DH2020_036196 [Rehmannia glutinosa]|uniref:F-box protein At3g26010-like beta-propeller domain-containing protein n=1 Tax=Rehmannia glutinosa TaxID=99300 RepID=A0ABR0V744_REHGL
MGSDQEYFSSDIIFDILTRTPSLKTLDTCKCVSKTWKRMIYESSFMPTYCKRTDNVSGYFIQDMKNNKHVSVFVSIDQSEEEGGRGGRYIGRFPYDDMKILASCNQGLLCCVQQKYRAYRYYVCKPATRQWQALPNPKLCYETVAVAIMVLRASPLRYKIVRLSKLDIVEYVNYRMLRCEIFDSDLWTWRETQVLNLPYNEMITKYCPAVCVGNSVHWLTNHDNVLAFHEDDKSFDKFSLPQTVNDACECKQLLEYQGRLGFTCLRKKDSTIELCTIELWLNDGPRNYYQWTKKMDVNISNLEAILDYPSPAGFYNAEIAFIDSVYEATFYKIQDCSVRKVKLSYEFRYSRQFFQFRSDLESVNLKGG